MGQMAPLTNSASGPTMGGARPDGPARRKGTMARTIGHNGTTGWVSSPRRDELAAKRSARQAAIRAAWAEIDEEND